ncbi:putative U-box domain-containing protein 13-like [Sesbania bispinosa]|nr:putative U-box domain-containing protein 13-like [Sesbania bispinosa]
MRYSPPVLLLLIDLLRFESTKGKENSITLLLGLCKEEGELVARRLLANPRSIPSLQSLAADGSLRTRRKKAERERGREGEKRMEEENEATVASPSQSLAIVTEPCRRHSALPLLRSAPPSSLPLAPSSSDCDHARPRLPSLGSFCPYLHDNETR